ncbi:MAG: (d)CMP kinase [Clostridia bacterium]|nr:(d)CMP kinase [Clostridia bacterium]
MKIAIDGPVGAGKSTISDAVARELGILHLDTGAMYRAVGLTCLRRGINTHDEAAVTALCQDLRVDVEYADGAQRTLADGEDLTGLIRTQEVSDAASLVGTYGGVRAAMVKAQQRLAATQNMLMDGRDIGTVVLPDADVKIFLTASAEERARRRWQEMRDKGEDADYDAVLAALRERDAQDMGRAVDPLRCAEDAVTVDTTHLSFDESVSAILNIIRERTATRL